MPRLKSASGFNGLEIVASHGIKPRAVDTRAHDEQQDHGGRHHHLHAQDPHAWQDVRNVVSYVRNIAEGFAQADPPNAAHYRAREAAYVARLDALDAQIRP